MEGRGGGGYMCEWVDVRGKENERKGKGETE